jgi:hypothetical protein
MTIAIKHLLVCFLALWSGCGLAAGWNDFARDIGHGFRLWKASGFDVCISRVDPMGGAVVCGDKRKGDYGPVSGYFFTDEYLLVRTHGAKPEENSELFETDIDREHFFIIKKKMPSRERSSAIGPLDRDEFYNSPVVPADIQWELPTRFDLSSRNEGERSALESIIITAIAWPVAFLIVFGPIIIWPISIFFVVRWILRRRRMISRDNN